ncbi:hypothetical protein [Nonomuraea typhae]|uniref:hypothetical protein n=1 Tax=Nonomuraea typhae TaxID=2603600 RepID=UPI0012FB3E95|nr:hypothetical protein [Nonomuraea typhae]
MAILWRVGVLALGLGVLMACSGEAAAPVRSPVPSPSATEAGRGQWRQVDLPGFSPGSGLVKMAVTGPLQAWAGGYEAWATDQASFALLLRWDGKAWREVPVPADFGFISVDGLGMDDDGGLWLASDSEVARLRAGKWTVHRPFGIARGHYFRDLATDDGRVTLVGGSPTGAMVVEWDGKEFQLTPQKDGVLTAVTAGKGHTWAVGATPQENRCAGVTPMIMRQDPDDRKKNLPLQREDLAPIPDGVLYDVWQAAPDNVWAVGAISAAASHSNLPKECPRTPEPRKATTAPLVMHWDGVAWKRVELPAWDVALTSVTVTEDGQVWAGGDSASLVRYDGSRWTMERPLVSGPHDRVHVSAIPGGSGLWAYGYQDGDKESGKAFVLRSGD